VTDLLVVGCGLIGTSIGLALQGAEGSNVLLADKDLGAVHTAVTMGAGTAWDGQQRVDLAVVAVPPGQTARELTRLQRLDIATTYTHVCSVQAQVQREIEDLSPSRSSVVGGHPLAGREVSGPEGALADLFVGRPWAVCPGSESAEDAIEQVDRLARACGAVPVRVEPQAHDQAVALLSHLPHVTSSALAGLLADQEDASTLHLSGPGLADTTRLAAGDPDLWTAILSANAVEVAGPVRALARSLEELAVALQGIVEGDRGASERVRGFLVRGNHGRAHVPIKRGELAAAFVGVRVEVADAPGRLAALLTCAGDAGANVEDVRVEHVPGNARGVIELLVAPGVAAHLRDALDGAGWRVL
jgi:prephenate dehydrogenase